MNKLQLGLVIKKSSNKTFLISIKKKYSHKKYLKIITSTKKLLAHSNNNLYNQGDIVLIRNYRPISKRKHWVIEKQIFI